MKGGASEAGADLLDEIAAREEPVGELLNGALRGFEGGCQLREGDAARVQGHGVEDLDHSVDGAMRTRRHVVTLASRCDKFGWLLTSEDRSGTQGQVPYMAALSVYPLLYPELRSEEGGYIA
jgi:hypothetical protein